MPITDLDERIEQAYADKVALINRYENREITEKEFDEGMIFFDEYIRDCEDMKIDMQLIGYA